MCAPPPPSSLLSASSQSPTDPADSLALAQESISAETLAKNSFKTTEVGFGAWLWSWIAGTKKTDEWTLRKFEADKTKIQLSTALQYGAYSSPCGPVER